MINDDTTRRVTRSARSAKQISNRQMSSDAIDGIDGEILDALNANYKDGFDTSGSSETDTENEENDKTKKTKCALATRALVFMLSGIDKTFEFPVGYHLVNGLGSDGFTDLIKEVMIKVSTCGVKIANLTMDGAKENLKMCENMGANLDPLSDEFKPFFPSPHDGNCTYVLLDPSHMENLLGNHRVAKEFVILVNFIILSNSSENEIWCF